jgi:hypothetical protein
LCAKPLANKLKIDGKWSGRRDTKKKAGRISQVVEQISRSKPYSGTRGKCCGEEKEPGEKTVVGDGIGK